MGISEFVSSEKGSRLSLSVMNMVARSVAFSDFLISSAYVYVFSQNRAQVEGNACSGSIIMERLPCSRYFDPHPTRGDAMPKDLGAVRGTSASFLPTKE